MKSAGTQYRMGFYNGTVSKQSGCWGSDGRQKEN